MFSTNYLDAIGSILTFMFWWFIITACITAAGVVGGIGYFVWWLLS